MKKIFNYFISSAMCLLALSACKNGDLSGYTDIKTDSIAVDVEEVGGIDAQDPAEVSIIVDCPNAWVATVDDNWASVSPNYGGGGKEVVTITVTPNFKNVETDMPARATNIRISSHGTTRVIPVRQNGYIGEKVEVTSLGGIPDAAEFKAFADAASAGLSVARWTNEETKAVELLADIDLTPFAPWVPICAGTSSNAGAVDGSLFEGVFDGKGHTIKGLKMDVTPVNKTGYGLFGVVSGGTIKNLTVETSGIKVTNPDCSANATIHIGVIAGAVVKGTIEGCVAKAAGDATVALEITGAGTGLQTVGGIAGTAYESKILNCENNVKLLCFNETNTNNGGTGVSMAGIVGYCNGSCEFSNCINQAQIGDMIGAERWGSACRLSGIAATTQGMVTMDHCTNNGKLVGTCICTSDKTSRTAGIIAYVNTAGSQMTNCVNNGDVCFAPAGEYGGYLGGLFGQTANAFVIDGCESHGAILGDLFVDGHFYKRGDASEVIGSGLFSDNLDTDTFPEMGLVSGRPNSKATTVKNCKFSGKIGAYNKTDAVVITAANFTKYLYGCTYARRKAIQENADNVNNTYSE